jgi:hypothetical protein
VEDSDGEAVGEFFRRRGRELGGVVHDEDFAGVAGAGGWVTLQSAESGKSEGETFGAIAGWEDVGDHLEDIQEGIEARGIKASSPSKGFEIEEGMRQEA